MSDDEYDSDNASGSEDSDSEIITSKKPLNKNDNVKKHKYVDEDIDDADDDAGDDDVDDTEAEDDIGEEDDDVQIGGGADEEEDEEDDDDDDDDDDDEDLEGVDDDNPNEKISASKTNKVNTKPKRQQIIQYDDDDDEDEDDEYEENYLRKFDNDIIKNYVNEFHPECLNHNYEEIAKMASIVRNVDGIIIDPLHKTIPYLTKYEKARILGQRSKQIETGAKPLVKVPENIIDSYIIAELELKEKKIPFIIRRPIPGGACEYWHLRDLENIGF